jgi:hypothetical protein
MGKETSHRPAGDVGHSTRLSAEHDTGAKLLNRESAAGPRTILNGHRQAAVDRTRLAGPFRHGARW